MSKIVKEDIQNIIHADLPWSILYNKNVLITGANGYIAQYIVRTLLALNKYYNANINIICLSRKKYIQFNSVKTITQDICDPFKTDYNTDYIFHMASNAKPSLYKKDPIGTIGANVLGTLNLLNTFPHAKMLYFSSGGVYGHMDQQNIPIDENNYGYIDPTYVEACYNESKRMAENICVSHNYQYNTSSIIVRPSYVYGPLMNINDERVCSQFIANAMTNKTITLTGNIEATRSFCYISDAIIGFFTALFLGVPSEAYNIGSDTETKIIDLAKCVQNLFTRQQIEIKYKSININSNTVNRSFLNINKIKKLGWQPSISLSEGLQRTILSYK